MTKSLVRWLGGIKTDLSVPLEGLTNHDIRELIHNSKDDVWAHQFASIIANDVGTIEWGMSNPTRVTVRDLAVHVMNRYLYFTHRSRCTDPRVHRLLDTLICWNVTDPGCMPASVSYNEDDDVVREAIGQYNFQAPLVREHFNKTRHLMPYEPIATDRYQ